MPEIILCKHHFPYGCCAVCQADDEAWIRKWENEFRKFDESNDEARQESED